MSVLLICLIVLPLLTSPRWGRIITIRRWRSALDLDKHLLVFTELYAEVDGFALSRKARIVRDVTDYVYGEIEFISFIALLSLAKPDKNTVFYDLGSGTGKAVLACAMVFNVQKSNGVELFDSLNNAACERQQALLSLPEYKTVSKNIHFIHGDFLQVDFNDATLIYINSTGFFGTTWNAISNRLAQATHCTTVITTSKALKSHAFTVCRVTTVQMSWGTVKAYIHHRSNPPIN